MGWRELRWIGTRFIFIVVGNLPTLWKTQLFLRPLSFHYKWAKVRDLSSACQTDQADFTDWMSFILSNLMEEINPNPEALSAKYLKTFISKGALKRQWFRYKYFNIADYTAILYWK